MGICFSNDEKNASEDIKFDDGNQVWHTETSGAGTHIKFEVPKIPVIFVLGGPGSGKVTHCDKLAEEKRGVIHINMTDLLQQYVIGSGENKDFNELSSKTVAEVLMLEIKMAPAAKTILVSGYPRSMRDVVEYKDKIQTVSGVILLSWEQNSLERQIEYGAKLGHVVLDLARMELTNFCTHVKPVSDFFDQHKILTLIDGERNPKDVYHDFRVAVLRIIGSIENVENTNRLTQIPNGKVVTSTTTGNTRSRHNPTHPIGPLLPPTNKSSPKIRGQTMTTSVSVHAPKRFPTFIYVIGGPGSKKGTLITKVIRRVTQWAHISTGELLRDAVNSRFLPIEEAQTLRDAIASGELVDKDVLNRLMDRAINDNIDSVGIIIDGFPRDMDQLHDFEEKYDQHPAMILLDCSKLQLSRGRWDDNIPAFRRRLEVFRERTLPMLKVIDTEHRLTMVDGDTETPEVEEAFTISLYEVMQLAEEELASSGQLAREDMNQNYEAALLSDLREDMESNSRKPSILINGVGPPMMPGVRERITRRGDGVGGEGPSTGLN